MDNYEFKIGDRIACMRDHPDRNCDIVIGSTGTVCYISDDKWRIGVRWDERIYKGHSCKDCCDDGYGWFIDSHDAELICVADDDSEISFDEEYFNSFLLENV